MLAVGSFFVRDRVGLRWPAVGVLVTVVANGVVGGIAVRSDLHPALVQSHFLLAMLSISFGVIAIRRSGPRARMVGAISPVHALLMLTTFCALVTGTVVTGTGPHAGEEDVRRFGFDISNVARIHSITVLLAIGVALWLAYSVNHRHDHTEMSSLSAWIFVALLQGGVGYIQYFNGVPELLVGAHIALATGLWVITMVIAVDSLTLDVERGTSERQEGDFAVSPVVGV